MDVKDECSGSIDTFLVELRSTCALVSDVCRLLDVHDRLLRSTQSLVHAEWLVTTAAQVARMDSVWTLLGRNEHVLALEEYKIGEYKRVIKCTKTSRANSRVLTSHAWANGFIAERAPWFGRTDRAN